MNLLRQHLREWVAMSRSPIFFDVPDKDGNLEAEASREQEDIRGMTDNSNVEEQEEASVVERRTALLDDTTVMYISSMAYGKKNKSAGATFRDFLVKRSTHFSDQDTNTLCKNVPAFVPVWTWAPWRKTTCFGLTEGVHQILHYAQQPPFC